MAHKKDQKVVLTVEQLKTLMLMAFQEGYQSGILDEQTVGGGAYWVDTKAHKSMEKIINKK